MIKAIFFDIDGTILSHTIGAVPQGTKEAFDELKKKGIKLFAATGRHLTEMQQLPVNELPFDGYVTLNGQLCQDADKNLFFSTPIHQMDVQQILAVFEKNTLPVMIVEKDKMYINYIDEKVCKAQKAISTALPEIGEYHGGQIYQFMVYIDEKAIDKIPELSYSKIIRWNENAVDILPKAGGKMVGISEMLKLHQISKEEIMVFGDGGNDIDMLHYAAIGIAMGNASSEVKSHADYVTGSVDDDGIRKALKHYRIL